MSSLSRGNGPIKLCSTCSGEGKHSRHLGVVDPADFEESEWADYLAGAHDLQCATCEGTGRVRAGDPEADRLHAKALCADQLGDFHAGELYG